MSNSLSKVNDSKTFRTYCHPTSLKYLLFWLPSSTLYYPITLNEIEVRISNVKDNKTPESDDITYELYKNRSPSWIHYILNLFNIIFTNETVRESWFNIQTIILFKKGDKNDLSNYRPIALFNTIAKIYTQILPSHLQCWVEEFGTLNEFQMGFRKNRGTIDNIYCLTSITNIHLWLKRNKIYAIFIDLKKHLTP